MKKLTKKELKQPDQFVGFWQLAGARVGRWAAENAKVLVISVSALAPRRRWSACRRLEPPS
jgi:hypothetical protein